MKVEQIGNALNHYCAALGAQRKDTSEYARLAEMLKRRAHISTRAGSVVKIAHGGYLPPSIRRRRERLFLNGHSRSFFAVTPTGS